MRKALLLIAAAIFIFAGCQKEQSEQESKTNNVIHVNVKQISPATRVIADATDLADTTPDSEVAFCWEEGDKVIFLDFDTINFESPEGTIYECTNPISSTFTYVSGPELNSDATYTIMYPGDKLEQLWGDLPYVQTYRANQIPSEHQISAENVSGIATEFTLDIHQSMAHFKLTGSKKIKRIELHSDFGDGTRVPNSALSCGDGVQLTDSPTDFYMDINAGGAFSLIIYDDNQKKYTKSTDIDLDDYYRPGNVIVDFDKVINVDELPVE